MQLLPSPLPRDEGRVDPADAAVPRDRPYLKALASGLASSRKALAGVGPVIHEAQSAGRLRLLMAEPKAEEDTSFPTTEAHSADRDQRTISTEEERNLRGLLTDSATASKQSCPPSTSSHALSTARHIPWLSSREVLGTRLTFPSLCRDR